MSNLGFERDPKFVGYIADMKNGYGSMTAAMRARQRALRVLLSRVGTQVVKYAYPTLRDQLGGVAKLS